MTAQTPFEQGKPYSGRGIEVTYDATRCIHYAECVRGLPAVFDTQKRPWIQVDNAAASEVAEVVRRCHSGALQYRLADGPAEAPRTPTSVTAYADGAVVLEGDLQLDGIPADVDYVAERETRLTSCGCGKSALWLLCDNTYGHTD
ncbi:putative Fe-S cluster protein YjdI [Branchiibius hedensis]|uniref:Uncharacterized Fe-S cluster protein YjdI n=1 Tax=Branchiibius hedensis TaxID=672460 RepID=A0A2Y8ZT54_9MICO|nr:(4Fe-4S)-binding protein [Branchiibius hedensis]PWJ26263.1 putative Fe-S cluster protein YjdI [Branchiibius hedensis]SSA35075.1 Uncharacterized Fe-S cluster protein YjdI [Branchiibius hedensis]